MTFAERLKVLRQQSGLTQEGLAEKASLSVRTLQSYEAGYREPDWARFLALCQALDVQAEVFRQEKESNKEK